MMFDIPIELRSAEKQPLPASAVKLCRDLMDNERFLRLTEDGFSIPEAGHEALGSKSPQTAYTRLEQIREAGTPEDLFRDRAVELFGRRDFPWGHKIEDGPWAQMFFCRLAGGREELDRLGRECKTMMYTRNALARYSDDRDVATYQAILFGVSSGEFGGAA
jgi:hypothetical protein